MRLEFRVGGHDEHVVEFRSNTLLGTTGIRLDGRKLYSSMQLTSQEGPGVGPCDGEIGVVESQPAPLALRWAFDVGSSEKHHVAVTRSRPSWFPIFRPHRYRVEVDSEVVIERTGY